MASTAWAVTRPPPAASVTASDTAETCSAVAREMTAARRVIGAEAPDAADSGYVLDPGLPQLPGDGAVNGLAVMPGILPG